jgi:hydroxymethylbilane synthase
VSQRVFLVGTRGSRLALRQTDIVLDLLRAHHSGATFETVTIKTEGDASMAPLSQLGGRGVFVAEIERALLSGEIDIAVHSLKDLPADQSPGLTIAATPQREDVRDALITRHETLSDLNPGAIVGTCSARRSAQLLAIRPDLQTLDIRGNVETRIAKVDSADYDAAILAVAGLNRLGIAERANQVFSLDEVLPAPGQGGLAVQVREGDAEATNLTSTLDDPATRAAVTAERAFERRLGTGCSAAVAALGTLEPRGTLRLRGLVGPAIAAHPEGSKDAPRILRAEMEGSPAEADMLGVRLAEYLIAQGAEELLEAKA